MREQERKEYYDLVYDVYKSGGNPDAVDPERFEHDYQGHYDFFHDQHIVRRELKIQKGK
jgi:hypothetical protein